MKLNKGVGVMRKREERDNPESCFNRAKDDELVFVLLERDHAAPAAIRAWCHERIMRGMNKPEDAKITEALRVADMMNAGEPQTITSMGEVYRRLADGYRIRVPKAAGIVELRDGMFQRHGGPEREKFLLDPGLLAKLQATMQVGKVAEYSTQYKLGWRDLGYDGDVADWYGLIQ